MSTLRIDCASGKSGNPQRCGSRDVLATATSVAMAKEEDDDSLPDKDAAKEFYAKYEPKEIIGRFVSSPTRHYSRLGLVLHNYSIKSHLHIATVLNTFFTDVCQQSKQ